MFSGGFNPLQCHSCRFDAVGACMDLLGITRELPAADDSEPEMEPVPSGKPPSTPGMRTPQGRPVIIQAGQSGRGRHFAARWAELMFAIFQNRAYGQREYRETKTAVAQAGRDPDSIDITFTTGAPR